MTDIEPRTIAMQTMKWTDPRTRAFEEHPARQHLSPGLTANAEDNPSQTSSLKAAAAVTSIPVAVDETVNGSRRSDTPSAAVAFVDAYADEGRNSSGGGDDVVGGSWASGETAHVPRMTNDGAGSRGGGGDVDGHPAPSPGSVEAKHTDVSRTRQAHGSIAGLLTSSDDMPAPFSSKAVWGGVDFDSNTYGTDDTNGDVNSDFEDGDSCGGSGSDGGSSGDSDTICMCATPATSQSAVTTPSASLTHSRTTSRITTCHSYGTRPDSIGEGSSFRSFTSRSGGGGDDKCATDPRALETIIPDVDAPRDAVPPPLTSPLDSVAETAPPPPPPLVILRPTEDPVLRPPPGVRRYTDGRNASYKLPPLARLLAQVTLGMYVGWPYVLLALLFCTTRGSVVAAAVLVVLMSTLLLPATPQLWEGLLSSSLFRLWRAYFNYSFMYEELPDLTLPHIFVASPHGAFPLSQILGGSLGYQMWPGHPIHCLAASCLFYVPFWRHMKAWMGAAPATRSEGKRLLRTTGSIAVLAGGIAEMFEQGRQGQRERLKLRDRKGFVRLAVELGVPIVPVYHFGNSQALSFAPTAPQWLSRRLRVAVGTVVGVWGLPIPRQHPLFMCVGRPVQVCRIDPRDKSRFDREVDETLDRVIASYQNLYERNAGSFGWADRPLEVC